MANKAVNAEQYKDVIHEDAIKVAGATKAPDYCFRIGGVRKFFLETKKPSITPDLSIDDKPLKEIFKNLYYPDSPYEFSVLGADILGHVYEQFLRNVIRLTEGHRAKVEEKPEVRKAGGVYYTPTYIVEYIDKNTVGKLCEGKGGKWAGWAIDSRSHGPMSGIPSPHFRHRREASE